MSTLGRIQVGGAGLSAGAIDNIAKAMFEMQKIMEQERRDEIEAQSAGGKITAKATTEAGKRQASSERTKAIGQVTSGSVGAMSGVVSMIPSAFSRASEKQAIKKQECASSFVDGIKEAKNKEANLEEGREANGATEGQQKELEEFYQDLQSNLDKSIENKFVEKNGDQFQLKNDTKDILDSIIDTPEASRLDRLNKMHKDATEAYKSFRKEALNHQQAKNNSMQAFNSLGQSLGAIGSSGAAINSTGDTILAAIEQGVKENGQTSQQMAHSAQDATSASVQSAMQIAKDLGNTYAQMASTQRV